MPESELKPKKLSIIKLCSILSFLCYCYYFKNLDTSLKYMAYINFTYLQYLLSTYLSLLFIAKSCDKLVFLHKNKVFLLLYEIFYFILGITEGMVLASFTVGWINFEIRWNLLYG